MHSLRIFLIAILAFGVFAQQPDSVIQWLTALQDIEKRLRVSNNRTLADLASEVQTLHREIAASSLAARILPGLDLPDDE